MNSLGLLRAKFSALGPSWPLWVLSFLASYIVARGGLFFSPIALANLLSPADYGTLELAQSLASVGATLVGLGTSSAVPLVLLRNIGGASWGGVLMHHLVAAGALLAVACFLALEGASRVTWLACLCTMLALLQSLWSTVLMSRGRSEAAVLLDAGAWGVPAVAVLLAAAMLVPPPERSAWMLVALTGYFAVLAVWTMVRFREAGWRTATATYATTVRTAFPLMMVGLLTLLLTTSGRIGIGLLSSPDLTAQYATLGRPLAMPIIAYQIITIAGFRHLYKMPSQELESALSAILLLVAASIVAFWALSDVVGVMLGPAFVSAFQRHHTVGLLILAQCIPWCAIVLNDLVNTRSGTTGKAAIWAISYLAVSLPAAVLFLSARSIELSVFVPVHSAIMGGYFITQVAAMHSRGIRLYHPWLIAFVAFALLSALAYML